MKPDNWSHGLDNVVGSRVQGASQEAVRVGYWPGPGLPSLAIPPVSIAKKIPEHHATAEAVKRGGSGLAGPRPGATHAILTEPLCNMQPGFHSQDLATVEKFRLKIWSRPSLAGIPIGLA